MTSTTFIDKVTKIEADWANDVDTTVYDGPLLPEFYGAVGDGDGAGGGTDDTIALQAGINQASILKKSINHKDL